MTGSAVLPPRLRPGDVVAVISPSAGDAARYARRAARGVRALEELGFVVDVMPNATRDRSWVSGTVRERVDDVHRAFADERVRAIASFIGGNHSAQLLGSLDHDLIAGNPKVLFGYSDMTSLLHAVHRMTGLVTFYGPQVLPQFGEWPRPMRETVDHFRAVTSVAAPAGAFPVLDGIVREFIDWADDEVRPREQEKATGRRVIRDGRARGPLVAGCLPTIRHLVGTPWQVDCRGSVLVLDIPDSRYRVADADADLWHLRNARIMDGLAGLVVCRSRHFDEPLTDQLCDVIDEVTRPYGFPVLAEFESGHGDPALTIPIGPVAELSGAELTVLDAAVC
ncbi:MccF-like protein [Lentzea tibetensis]|uniref:MccF-like protein n=1 Tax=Lentzea tibetensis TaxID=2591470 RepID=A0A563ERZ8_9PSEU|nr:LD-carboxypeptidase [Lentzea tibetensis]TWP50430.1 MccF-like protein [Lentzea tibetensis]